MVIIMENKIKILFRIEGVNLGNFIYNTNDLKTIRGGSLAMLEFPHYLGEEIQGLTPISLGASIGLFLYEGENTPKEIKQQIQNLLDEKYQYALPYGTYVIAHQDITGQEDLLTFEKKLTTKCRIEQMQTINVNLLFDNQTLLNEVKGGKYKASLLENESYNGVCEIDGVTPSRVSTYKGKEQIETSLTTAMRRNIGHHEKSREFYKRIIADKDYEELEKIALANDFHQICQNQGNELDGKMVVIYLDGNSFTKSILAEVDKEEGFDAQSEKLKDFDKKLRENRSEFLKSLLTKFINEGDKAQTDAHKKDKKREDDSRKNYPYTLLYQDFKEEDKKECLSEDYQPEKVLRLETLLWGGDEMMFVLPAWLAFDFLETFFSCVYNQDKPWKIGEKQQSFAVGMVFCSMKAPIDRIKNYAYGLAELAKGNRDKSLIAFQVLESFDFPAENFAEFREKSIPSSFSNNNDDPFILNGEDISELRKNLSATKKYFPRRQLYEIVRKIHNNEDTQAVFKQLKILYSDKDFEKMLQNMRH